MSPGWSQLLDIASGAGLGAALVYVAGAIDTDLALYVALAIMALGTAANNYARRRHRDA